MTASDPSAAPSSDAASGARAPAAHAALEAVWRVVDDARGVARPGEQEATAVVLAHLVAGTVDDVVAAARAAAGAGDAGGADGGADGGGATGPPPAVRAAADALAADRRGADRLALGVRRVLGEGLAAAAAVLGTPLPPATRKALRTGHRRRCAALGLPGS